MPFRIELSTFRFCFSALPARRGQPFFQDLAVWQHPGARAHFQRHPVLFLTFKDIRSDTWESTFRAIRLLLQDLCLQFRDLIATAALAPEEVHELQTLLDGEATDQLGWVITHLTLPTVLMFQRMFHDSFDGYSPLQKSAIRSFLEYARDVLSAGDAKAALERYWTGA